MVCIFYSFDDHSPLSALDMGSFISKERKRKKKKAPGGTLTDKVCALPLCHCPCSTFCYFFSGFGVCCMYT